VSDLIWIGNTLYPRWFVFAVAGAVILAVVILWTWATEG
jgi:hypothetical protein